MALNPKPANPLTYLLTRNFVTGCSAAFNRRLLTQALPMPLKGIAMHDWWLASVAAITGEIHYIPRALVKYRQHGGNTIGASDFWGGLIPLTFGNRSWQLGSREFALTFRQAEELYQHGIEKGDWSESKLAVVDQYRRIPTLSLMQRFITAFEMGLRKDNVVLRAVYFIRLLYMPKAA
jgi:hypothetical protein